MKFAIQQILSDPTTGFLKNTLSQKKKVERRNLLGEDVDYWTSPALLIGVAANNEKLGGGSLSIGGTADPVTEGKEQFSRAVQSTLRGESAEANSYGSGGYGATVTSAITSAGYGISAARQTGVIGALAWLVAGGPHPHKGNPRLDPATECGRGIASSCGAFMPKMNTCSFWI